MTRMPTCPSCGSVMKLRRSKDGNFWGCRNYPRCRWTIGIRPDGTLNLPATDELRKLRQKTHDTFDAIWRNGDMTRTRAYKWLSKRMDIPSELCHIGYFNEDQCKEAIGLCEKRADGISDKS